MVMPLHDLVEDMGKKLLDKNHRKGLKSYPFKFFSIS